MGKSFILCVCLVVTVFFGCSTKELRVQEFRISPDTPDPAKPPEEFYVIGAGDSIGIQVWKEPTLSGNVTVRPDGYVTLPLLNEVQVVGLTTGQLRKLLEQKYKEFTTDPFVTISVGGIASAEVFLIAPSTGKNAAYPLRGNETIMQLLTRSGGLGIFADRSNIRIVRREGPKITEYIVDYDAIVKGDLKQDILLRPGDRVIIP
ncbi:MAG TPA: polysaccharide biosynthesis/export family protein [Candidatus Udaeobacter sp.]|jgi:polysaccharide biosynthesis/export protein|nr:polysaccharide biosynthesis/export family protein [Candidatus Udaeobacter sp.]